MHVSDWRATWITGQRFTPPQGCSERACVGPSPLLRTTFSAGPRIVRARLYASGLGYGTYFIDGRGVSKRILDPGFTDYSLRVFYDTFDVTKLIRRGRNALGAMLGRGPYDDTVPNNVYYPNAAWHHEPELRAELVLTYAGGRRQIISTGPSWKTTDGPIRYDDYMAGETYDARRAAALRGWALPGVNTSSWGPASPSSPPRGTVVAQYGNPVLPAQRVAFTKITEPAPGDYVFWLPYNLAGNAVLDLDVPTGDGITLHYGEQLDDSGHIPDYTLGGGSPDVFQVDHYIGGPGVDHWRPEFTYKGFQYVEITGLRKRPPLSALHAEAWHSDIRSIGSWTSSNPLANLILTATRRTVLSNMLWQPTDTPIYEKTGYTADAQLMAPSDSYLFDMRRFYAKWLVDIENAQSPSGEIPEYAPSAADHNAPPGMNTITLGASGIPAFPGPSPGWDAALFEIGETIRRFGGDARPLLAALPAMKNYAGYIASVAPNGTVEGSCAPILYFPCANGLGDWSGPTGEPHGVSLDSTAWYYEMMRVLADAATLAHDPTTVQVAESRRAQIAAAFNQAFRDPLTGTYRDLSDMPNVFSQHQNAVALELGLVPKGSEQTVGDAIAHDVEQRGGHLFTGSIGTRFLWDALTSTGHLDDAWTAATQTTYPSYGYWLKTLGWTTLGETWEATARSRNHEFLGTVVQWLFEDIAGMQPSQPGFAQIQFKPEVPTRDLDWVRASTNSVRGTVASAWRKRACGIDLDVTVPPNATGTVYLPGTNPNTIAEVGEGHHQPAQTAPDVTLVGVQGGRLIYHVSSGTYRFRCTP